MLCFACTGSPASCASPRPSPSPWSATAPSTSASSTAPWRQARAPRALLAKVRARACERESACRQAWRVQSPIRIPQHEQTSTAQMACAWGMTRIVSSLRCRRVMGSRRMLMDGFARPGPPDHTHASCGHIHVCAAPELRIKYGSPGATDEDGFNPYEDSVGPGIYGGNVLRDEKGDIVIGQQYQNHNPKPGNEMRGSNLRREACPQPKPSQAPRPGLMWKRQTHRTHRPRVHRRRVRAHHRCVADR